MASKLTAQAINATMNSDEVSRKMDAKAGLEQYVRLSFNNKNPMMFVCREKGRIANPVVLQVKLEVVSRPGVLFADCNATRKGAIISESPNVVRFDVVKKPNHFAVPELLRHFYQAEVLVPSPIPPHLISIPRIKRTLGKPKIAKAAKATTATSSTATKDCAPSSSPPASMPPIIEEKSMPSVNVSPVLKPSLSPAQRPLPPASPSMLIHKKVMFAGELVCECGETGCEEETSTQPESSSSLPAGAVKPKSNDSKVLSFEEVLDQVTDMRLFRVGETSSSSSSAESKIANDYDYNDERKGTALCTRRAEQGPQGGRPASSAQKGTLGCRLGKLF
jgi:hypothetical protein